MNVVMLKIGRLRCERNLNEKLKKKVLVRKARYVFKIFSSFFPEAKLHLVTCVSCIDVRNIIF